MNQNQLKLDAEELQILRDFERGEFASIKNFRAEKRQLEAAARKTLQKGKRINMRISARDLEKDSKTGGRGRDTLPDPHCQHFTQVRDRPTQGDEIIGVKKWYQQQPPEPNVDHILPHFKCADWH